jgi:hypothetical protein
VVRHGFRGPSHNCEQNAYIHRIQQHKALKKAFLEIKLLRT